jgi:thioredoxin 1
VSFNTGKAETGRIFEVDLDDFQDKVLAASATVPIMVDFWADWCGPCHALSPALSRVVDELDGAVRLAKVEVDEGENMKLAGRYGLRGFPTVILFHAGEELGRFSGAHPAHWVEHWLSEHAGPLLQA